MSIIKLALTADQHRNLARRRAESDRVHAQMLEEWKRREVDFIGFAGDFNECGMSDEDVIANARYLRECAQVAPVFLIDGNHGVPGELNIYDHRVWPLADANKIIVEPHAGVHIVETRKGPLAVVGVSFPQKQHLIAALGDIPLEDIDRIASEQLRNLFLGLGVRVRELGLPTVALIHGTVTGSKFSDARPPTTEGMILGLHDIAQIGADLTVVGHYHLGSDFKVNSASIVIPGSPYRNNHGENDTKSWVYAEFDTSVVNAEPGMCATWSRVPTNCQPMIHLEADYNPETQTLDYRDLSDFFPHAIIGDHLSLPNMANADVRLRYHFDKEHAQAAKEMADLDVKAFYSAGAETVKPEPIANPGSTVRDSEIIKATTLQEKIQKLWAARGFDPAERRAALLLKVDELLSKCGFGQRLNLDASIQLKNIRLKGFRCFQKGVSLSLESMPGEIIAVHGENGIGKSIFWELAVCGALYRDVPTHGHIGEHVLDKGAFTEAEFIYDGKTYVTKQLLNMSGGGSASLKINGETALKSALRSEYDKWAAENLPPFSLFTATSFAPQESKGILGMSKSERKALILRAKGVERYETLAETARKNGNEVSGDLSQVNARLGELGSETPPAVYENEILQLQGEKRRLEEELRIGEQTLSELRERNTAIDKERTEYDSKVIERRRLETEQAHLEERLKDVDTRIANNQTIVDQAQAIRDAHVEVDSLQQQLDSYQEAERDLQIAASKTESILDVANRELKAHNVARDQMVSDAKALSTLIATKASVQATIDSIPEFEQAVKECDEDRDGAFKEYEELQNANVVGLSGRVSNFRGDMRFIAEGTDGGDPASFAGGSLEKDDRLAQDAEEQPAKLRQAKAAWQQREQRSKEASEHLRQLQREAEKMDAIVQAEEKKTFLEEQIQQRETEIAAIAENIVTKTAELDALSSQIETIAAGAKSAADDMAKVRPLADKLSILNGAEVRLEELSTQQAEVAAKLELNKEMAHELSFLTEPPKPVPLFEHERAVANLRDSLSTNQTNLALAEKNLEQVRSVEQRYRELTAQATALRDTLADWTRLAQDLGRDGLQAEEVAGASVEINEIANEFLRSSGDTQYTIELSTTKLTKDKREVEGCPINVYNSETGQWQPGESLSPGQRAFVNLALSLTFASIGCKGSATKPTIFLDEPSSGLDPVRRPQYLEMLRHAVKAINASKIIFITHHQELIAMADARILIDSGKLVVS